MLSIPSPCQGGQLQGVAPLLTVVASQWHRQMYFPFSLAHLAVVRLPSCSWFRLQILKHHQNDYNDVMARWGRSQWPCGLRRSSTAARLLGLWVRIPPGHGVVLWVLSGRGLCDELITRREESYRLCCVVVCDLETSRMRRPWSALGRSATRKKNGAVGRHVWPIIHIYSYSTDLDEIWYKIP